METITIINKSGKVMSTSKHLVNIFKDAKLAYQEKKAEFREERRLRDEEKMAQRLLTERTRTSDVRSQASSHRSHRSRSHARTRGMEEVGGVKDRSRPPLTVENLSQLTDGSVASGTSRRGSRKGHDHGGTPHHSSSGYQKPYIEDALTSRPSLFRRHTDQRPSEPQSVDRRPTLPEMHTSPELAQKPIDMNLAYGEMHQSHIPPPPEQEEMELQTKMSRLDSLLLEAQCIGHSATSMIQSLQKNPEAMAAVALTLAEISNLVKIMSPGILSVIKGSSPAIFALLICPEFLIGTGVAVGVTIVMFGGYKIIKRIQGNNAAAAAAQKEAAETAKLDADGNQMEEAMVYDGDLSSVEAWMRGVEESQIGEGSVAATSVEGEFITPEAASIKKMRTKDRIARRAREERSHPPSTVGSASDYSYTVPARGSSRRSKSVVTDRTRGSGRGDIVKNDKARTMVTESEIADTETVRSQEKDKQKRENGKGKDKEKKPSVLKVLFKGKSEKVKMVGAA